MVMSAKLLFLLRLLQGMYRGVMMKDYIYSKEFSTCFAAGPEREGSATVVYYSSATETALMHFLNYLQHEDSLVYLSEATKKKFRLLESEFMCSDCLDGILCASIFFLSKIDNDIINDFNRLCNGKLGCASEIVPESELEKHFDEFGYAIKHLNIADSAKTGIPSYCSIVIPTAYMLRSTTDRDGYFKRWPSDSIIAEVMAGLQVKGLLSVNYSHVSALEDAVNLMARQHSLNSAELNLMVQSLLANNLISLYLEDRDIVQKPFSEIVIALFERGW